MNLSFCTDYRDSILIEMDHKANSANSFSPSLRNSRNPKNCPKIPHNPRNPIGVTVLVLSHDQDDNDEEGTDKPVPSDSLASTPKENSQL